MADTIMNLEPCRVSKTNVRSSSPVHAAPRPKTKYSKPPKSWLHKVSKYSVPEYGNPVPNRVGSRA